MLFYLIDVRECPYTMFEALCSTRSRNAIHFGHNKAFWLLRVDKAFCLLDIVVIGCNVDTFRETGLHDVAQLCQLRLKEENLGLQLLKALFDFLSSKRATQMVIVKRQHQRDLLFPPRS